MLRVGVPYARSAISKGVSSEALPAAARSLASTADASPRGASDIGVPLGGASSLRTVSPPPRVADIVKDAPAKSAAAVAAQNTATPGTPVPRLVSFANPRAPPADLQG